MKLSVAILTYNHERFIAQAIEGVLMQQTDFEYEIVIGEDCSTDGTREIVLDYAAKHPNRIRAFCRESNMGPRDNAKALLAACRGEYVAMLEGDDYWISPHKLQKQVALMESDGSYVVCGSRAYAWRDGDETPYNIIPNQPIETLVTFGLEELSRGKWWLRTCTRLYPRRILESIPDACVSDWLANAYVASQHPGARVGFINEVLAVYREHGSSVYSSLSAGEQARMDLAELQEGRPLFSGKYAKLIDDLIAERHVVLASLPGASRGARLAHLGAALKVSPFTVGWAFAMWSRRARNRRLDSQ
jgi:glycosyltransferase involved in cell wall biosynthesis